MYVNMQDKAHVIEAEIKSIQLLHHLEWMYPTIVYLHATTTIASETQNRLHAWD